MGKNLTCTIFLFQKVPINLLGKKIIVDLTGIFDG